MTVTDTTPRPRLAPRRLRPGPVAAAQPFADLCFAVVAMGIVFSLTPLAGVPGFVICTYLAFLALHTWGTFRREGGVAGRDRLATVLVATCALCTVIPLVLIVVYVVGKGLEGLTGNFFNETMATVGPLDPKTVGGAKHAIIGTVEQVGLAALLATPLGLMTAVYLSEKKQGRLARLVRLLVDAMSGIPSVVAGLFIYTMWVVKFGQGFSGLAAAMALAVLMLPTVARTGEEVLRIVPGGLREASLALGAPMWRTVFRVLLPAARSGLITATVLGVARIAGETAPLLMTAFGSDGLNTNPLDGAQSALPLFAFQRVRNAIPTQVARGWAGALVLIALVLALFTLARLIGARTRKAR